MNSSTCWYHLHHVGLHWTTMYRRWWLCRQGNRSTVVIVLLVIVDLSDRSNFSALSLSFLLFTNFHLLPLYSRNFCMSPLTVLHPMKRRMTSEIASALTMLLSRFNGCSIRTCRIQIANNLKWHASIHIFFPFLFSPLLSFPAAVWRTIRIKSKLLPGPVLSLVCCCTCADICVCVL